MVLPNQICNFHPTKGIGYTLLILFYQSPTTSSFLDRLEAINTIPNPTGESISIRSTSRTISYQMGNGTTGDFSKKGLLGKGLVILDKNRKYCFYDLIGNEFTQPYSISQNGTTSDYFLSNNNNNSQIFRCQGELILGSIVLLGASLGATVAIQNLGFKKFGDCGPNRIVEYVYDENDQVSQQIQYDFVRNTYSKFVFNIDDKGRLAAETSGGDFIIEENEYKTKLNECRAERAKYSLTSDQAKGLGILSFVGITGGIYLLINGDVNCENPS